MSAAGIQTERIGPGVAWLLTILTVTLAMFSGGGMAGASEMAGTARALAREQWFQLAIAANLVASACYLTATLLVHRLIKPASRNFSLLAAFFSVAACLIGTFTLLFQLAPLVVLEGGQHLGVFGAGQLRALALMFFRVSAQASTIGFAFFGFHCLLIGCSVVRSRFVPRLVGVLMVFVAGLGWLTLHT
jgi:hypothetical protein